MHIQTHIMSGWCLGDLLGPGKRERTLCIIAGAVYDLDGLGIIFGQVAYYLVHHRLCHNIFFGLIVAGVLTYFSQTRIRAFFAYILLFHVHLLMDYFGSGTDWAIYYFWPVVREGVENPIGWEFYSWQNISTAAMFLIWMLMIIAYKKRTPLELIMPGLDKQIVGVFEKIGCRLFKRKGRG